MWMMPKKQEEKVTGYVARAGLNYTDRTGKPKRVEPGEPCDDVPAHSLPWLLKQGLVEKKGD
jgi:hypothetical protein